MAQVNAPQAASWRLAHTCRSPALRSLGLLGRSCIVPARVVLARRPSRHFGHEIIQAQNAVQLKATGEGGSQPYSLSLRTADPLTAIGLVHRSLVTEAQNSRRVICNTRCVIDFCTTVLGLLEVAPTFILKTSALILLIQCRAQPTH